MTIIISDDLKNKFQKSHFSNKKNEFCHKWKRMRKREPTKSSPSISLYLTFFFSLNKQMS